MDTEVIYVTYVILVCNAFVYNMYIHVYSVCFWPRWIGGRVGSAIQPTIAKIECDLKLICTWALVYLCIRLYCTYSVPY